MCVCVCVTLRCCLCAAGSPSASFKVLSASFSHSSRAFWSEANLCHLLLQSCQRLCTHTQRRTQMSHSFISMHKVVLPLPPPPLLTSVCPGRACSVCPSWCWGERRSPWSSGPPEAEHLLPRPLCEPTLPPLGLAACQCSLSPPACAEVMFSVCFLVITGQVIIHLASSSNKYPLKNLMFLHFLYLM